MVNRAKSGSLTGVADAICAFWHHTILATNFGLNLRHGRVARLKVSCFQSGCSAVLIEAVWSLVFEEWFA